MKTTHFNLLITLVVSLISCSEKEYDSCQVNIRVVLPTDQPDLPVEKMKIVLTNKDQGNTYTSNFSAEGIATLNVEYGNYAAAVHYQAASGIIFSGRLESLSLAPGQEEATATLELVRSQTNALVIKEIYYGGCIGDQGEDYQGDQYITLYNNSEETIYLDGLCIGVVDPASNTQSPWMQYTDMARIPINDITWQFPGDGQQHPLAPGTETTIAANAINHIAMPYNHTNSVDLSKVDWGFWDTSLKYQFITPGVKPLTMILNLNPNLQMYSLPIVGPTLVVFGIEGTTAEAYINDPANREPRPQAQNSNKKFLMIPKQWVIDCVECMNNASQAALKRVPSDLDSGAAFISGNPYTGKSILRKSYTGEKGKRFYQDTNNSSEDMIVSTPELKNK